MSGNSKSSIWPVLFLALIFLVFLYGIAQLFSMRFEAGDVLPAYSTRRSDPLGAKGLYDSLALQGAVDIRRNYRPIPVLEKKLESTRDATLFFIGSAFSSFYWIDKEGLGNLERWAAQGGRVVIAFFPMAKPPYFWLSETKDKKECGDGDADCEPKKGDTDEGKKAEAEKKSDKAAGKKGSKKKDPKKKDPKKKDKDDWIGVEKYWGLKFEIRKGEPVTKAYLRDKKQTGLSNSISWHTNLNFKDLSKKWRVIYAVGRNPVVIERKIGRGSIVLCADSYLFSNEALHKESPSNFLVWMVNPSSENRTTVIFDETHLGLGEDPGVANLIRKYRLHGTIIVLLVLAGLFIWRNAFSLVPPTEEEAEGDSVISSERDSTAGLISLLKRNLPGRRILAICYKEWRKSFQPGGTDKDREEILAKAEDTVNRYTGAQNKEKDPVKGYQALCEILSEGKPWKKARSI